ncbi:MAG: YebC/PmpR family DNA-binding transcriptional regulator [Ardenticatenaceae bacterium]|nr:YebC/PmpR family DNA-binding transcriptional regulator [Anaerolineales bacterium]MCB8938362.1 YebC/PmpR family DNA-binding transcriptional regulator [Ardenticatenaceae bacterium]MCB8975331.1 YebC/PmpR family DNA-binding transcriptional regulator [Ardenticatenaceae bacterium]
MSGHSKWSTIKHKKAATDKKRGKIFTQLTKELTIAAREGGGDPSFNTRLGLAIDKAKANNMPKDNIERAVKRGTGELEGSELFELMYEAYAPNGVGLLVEVVTDNKNRAVADLRHALSKNGGNMAEAGSVAWQFTRKGYIAVGGKVDQDELFLVAADAGADDIQFGEVAEVYTELENFQAVREAIKDAGMSVEEASMVYEPNNAIELSESDALQVMRVIEVIEDLDDVQNVYSTLEISDEAIAAMEAA